MEGEESRSLDGGYRERERQEHALPLLIRLVVRQTGLAHLDVLEWNLKASGVLKITVSVRAWVVSET